MKNYPIKVMVSATDKKALQDKAQQLGLTLTAFLEKIAREEIIFLDGNARAMLKAFAPIFHQKLKK